MTPDHPTDRPERVPDVATIRREAVEIVQRHRRGLPSRHAAASPPPVVSQAEAAARALAEGRLFLTTGRVAEALLRADSAIGFASPGSDLLADGWCLRGESCIEQTNIQAARAAFKRAMAINPAHIRARMGLADSYQKMYQPRRAIPLYVETIPLLTDPRERARLRLLLADCYRAAGRPEAAQQVLRTVESARALTPRERLRALLTLALPTSPPGWLLLLLALLSLAATFSLAPDPRPALVAMLFFVGGYVALQWWTIRVR